jgi:acyl dehydratase
MPINPDAVGATSDPVEHSWTSRDSMLYALGVGADLDDLAFVTENTTDVDQQVLPTQAVVLNTMGGGVFDKIGDFNPAMLVHGEQAVVLHRPIPVAGTLSGSTTITGVYDKGKGALVVMESSTVLVDDGDPLFTNTMSAFIRGEGGWGGERGPSGPRNEAPDRAPDHEVTDTTRPGQALLYRLSGDRNPLHSDPAFAAMAGFDRPILHGLCTFGFAGRALLSSLCDDDPARFGSVEGRFSSPVFPGEELTTRMWVDGDAAVFQTAGGDGRVVLDAGLCTFTS